MFTLLCTVRIRPPLTAHDTVTPLDVSDTPNLDDCPQERGQLATRSHALRAAGIHREGQVLPNIVYAAELLGVVHLDTPSVFKASPGARSIRSSLPIGMKSLSSPRVSIVRPKRAGTTLKFEGSNPTGRHFHSRATSPGRDNHKHAPSRTRPLIASHSTSHPLYFIPSKTKENKLKGPL